MAKKVVITRDESRAKPLIDSLKEYGIDSYAVPMAKIEYIIKDPGEIKNYDLIAFTSVNAVYAFSENCKKYNFKLPEKIKIFSVGPATSLAIKKAFSKESIMSENYDSKSLASTIKFKVFWPCGEDALNDFSTILKNTGLEVKRWICYRKEAIDSNVIKSRLQELSPFNLVFFASPSQVRGFCRSWVDRSGFIAAAIGETTKKELSLAGFKAIVLASIPDCVEIIKKAL